MNCVCLGEGRAIGLTLATSVFDSLLGMQAADTIRATILSLASETPSVQQKPRGAALVVILIQVTTLEACKA